MKQLSTLLTTLLLSIATTQAQELSLLGRFDETNGGFQGHATQILQDQSGLMWIATWNGLCRFDGYEFRQLKPQAGDGCSMASDRIRDIWLSDDGDIYCRSDDDDYCFSTTTYRFRNLRDDAERQRSEQLRHEQSTRGHAVDGYVDFIDPQGLEWQLHDNALYCLSRIEKPAHHIPMPRPATVRCVVQDAKKRIWMSTREDATVRLLDDEGCELGYLTASGRLSKSAASFGHPVYCIMQTRNGTIWLGSKPDGLFRLRELSEGNFQVEKIEGLQDTNVYSLAEDPQGRVWVATLGGGVACIEKPDAATPSIVSQLHGYPKKRAQKVRYLHITPQGLLLAATTEGLIVSQLKPKLHDMLFRLHTREPERPTSLSCNTTMDIVQDAQGRIFVSTETGGINEILSDDLLADTLTFAHYDQQWGLPTDMIISMTLAGNRLLATSNTQFMLIDTFHRQVISFGHHFFHETFHFSEARPLRLKDGRWLMGINQGAFFLNEQQAHKSNYAPPLVLTGISIQNGAQNLAANSLDTLRLSPQERSLSIHFAALDYSDPHNVQYQYRLGEDSTAWNNIGHDHSVTLLDLKPGEYCLTLRSTNADGQWCNNERSLLIIAEPRFSETALAKVLLMLLVLGIVAAATYTYLYIKRIKRQRQETREAYLALLEQQKEEHEEQTEQKTDDPFVQRLLAFVEQNLANSDADIGQMAEACAVSRSVLQRKMKQLMGVTPIDFIREARLKHACHLLKTTDQTVTEVAYHCGFSDPKYFSRCFKQSVGVSPSEYKGGNA